MIDIFIKCKITFSLKKYLWSQVFLNNANLSQVTVVKYLGLHLESRLDTYPNEAEFRLSSSVSLEHKFLIYKAILKPVCTYGAKLWEVAAQSNIDIIHRFQSKVLR